MKKLFLLTCSVLLLSLASKAQVGAIYGISNHICVTDSVFLYDTTFGTSPGFWSSSNPSVASVTLGGVMGPSQATVYGNAAGVATISFSDGVGTSTFGVTVNPTPTSIIGSTLLCVTSTSTLTDLTGGGTWTATGGHATIGSLTGVAVGVSTGTSTIYYTLPTGCAAWTVVTVTPTSVIDTIHGPTTVCAGSTITLTDLTSGGVWGTSNPLIATISSSTGVLTGVASGVVVVSYSAAGTCGTATQTRNVTVVGSTSAGIISGASSVYVGSTVALSETITGGVWSSSNPSIAAIGTSGIVTGIAAGSATISYYVTGCSGPAVATFPITVAPINGISGHVLFTGTPYYGNVKVWLITYNSTTFDLQAVDSTVVSCSGSSVYYQFLGASTGSYRMKANIDTTSATTGYIPTYHTSSSYWSAATVLTHTAGTSDVNQDITMGTGTITTGPGFIGGNVLLGANKGTAATIPSKGLLIFVKNAAGTILQRTFTDASGNYSFSNLALGSYVVYPELLNYATTAFTGINLTAASSSATNTNFTQHTISKKITPVTAAVSNVSPSESSVIIFPNPSNGNVTIQWDAVANETGIVVISDITGRQIVKTTLDVNVGTGIKQLDLSSLTNGLYMISVKSASINYNSKIQIQH